MATEEKEPPTWCDKTFLEKAIKNGEKDSTLSIVDFDIERATASGDHYLSEMFRVHLRISQGNDKVKNTTVIIKIPPRQEVTAKMVTELGVFPRETTAFTKALPQMHQLLEEVSPGKYSPFAARCLYHEDTSSRTSIVLEDLKALGFKMAQRRAGLDLQHCLLVMRTLARFHASSVALRERDPDFIKPFLERPHGNNNDDDKKEENFLTGSIKSLADQTETWPGYEQYASRLRDLTDSCKDKYEEIVKSNPEEFNVLTHGDMWVNNMMFQYDDATNEPRVVRFVDYQLSQWNSPAIDIHYFLYTSAQPDIWDKHEFLIEEYHKELGKVLELLSLGHLHITLQELRDTLKKKEFHALFASVVVLPFVLRDPNNAVKLDEIISENPEDGIASQNMHSGVEIQRAYKKYIPIFADKGLI